MVVTKITHILLILGHQESTLLSEETAEFYEALTYLFLFILLFILNHPFISVSYIIFTLVASKCLIVFKVFILPLPYP